MTSDILFSRESEEVVIGNHRSLFKFYSEPLWAEKLADGEMLFRALSYYRDYEDNGVRGDPFEGSASYRPKGGLIMTNHTQGTVQTLLDHAVYSRTRPEEIFVFCMSRYITDELWINFEATTCVEILDPAAFCARVQNAVTRPATFMGPAGRQRIGSRVSYYHPAREKSARWALPDQIAITKHVDFAWQNEFRLAFSHTDALNPYRTDVALVAGEIPPPPKSADHASEIVKVGTLRDICITHTRPSL